MRINHCQYVYSTFYFSVDNVIIRCLANSILHALLCAELYYHIDWE